MNVRYAGVLAHITSLPGQGGIGDFGSGSYWFIDSLKAAGISHWQILPLNPTGYGNSPYSAYSAFASNPLLISLESIVEEGYLTAKEIKPPQFSETAVEFEAVIKWKYPLLRKAYSRFLKAEKTDLHAQFAKFCKNEEQWLEDYSIFLALKTAAKGRPWIDWEEGLRMKEPAAIAKACDTYWEEIFFHKYLQFQCRKQWSDLRSYAREKGITIVGDMPIFVAYDSADVWAHRDLFKLDEDGNPTVVAGVPPDFFSEEGQRWGNPHYDWEAMAKQEFRWWEQRFECLYKQVDIVRIDHFRGFQAAWEVEAAAPTAKDGSWAKAPGRELFRTLKKKFVQLPVIAEDLGIITKEVTKLREKSGFPGMKILQFGLGSTDPQHEYLPHNYEYETAVYTGTHDNDTSLSWFQNAPPQVQAFTREYLRENGQPQTVVREMMRLAYSSPAKFAFLPIQDILLQGTEARMNIPGKPDLNWAYRFTKSDLTPQHIAFLNYLTRLYNRK